MPLFEIPSADGYHSDIIFVRDQNNTDDLVYTHYAFTRGARRNPNEIRQRRGIPFNNFRAWDWFCSEFPDVERRLDDTEEYYPGEGVLSSLQIDPNFHVNTAMRLGALEILANIFSGRITANDKDPFPHQLALQQYLKANDGRVKRLLIADEVGLGKTIEIGLILRDLLTARGSIEEFRCLYLTKAGLLEDAAMKLQSVMKGTIDGQRIVEIVPSFRNYGNGNISGIRVASIDAARLYVELSTKQDLPEFPVKPEILIIDECHHCAADQNLTNPERIQSATQTYKAAYQMMTGSFWTSSEPPSLVVLMSATPFRSRTQFVNLLRLLAHESSVDNAFSNINEQELIRALRADESPTTVIWRQQDNVRSWSEQPLFPRLTVERIKLQTSPEYLEITKKICNSVQRIHFKHEKSFGGFATRQLEIRLTSSSIAGAIWLFRWCVQHQTWRTMTIYGQDTSEGTQNLRLLIGKISQRLAEFDEAKTSKHADVNFPSNGNSQNLFRATSLAQGGKVDDIYRFNEYLRNQRDENNHFIASQDEIIELTNLALKLLDFPSFREDGGVENTKLIWLRKMLEEHPESRFLVFTEILQTCEIITKALPRIADKLTGGMSASERERVVRRFRGVERPNIRVLVATSAADEGFDFQVANRVVHWDLSPSPAVLMQRNGRVARLGQISDVTAYYLIMEGTHEERREMALHQRFNDLGIQDEQLRLKILGSLTDDEEERILTAVEDEEGELLVVNEILASANQKNQEMNQKLGELQQTIQAQSVIDRTMLANRLKHWVELGLPPREENEFHFNFNVQEWERPIFSIDQETRMETARAEIALIQRSDRRRRPIKVTFDPEFNLFGADGDQYALAGLRPWVLKERRSRDTDVWKHRPMDEDIIGELAGSIARWREADFTVINAEKLYRVLPSELNGVNYLLFATHPFLEVETHADGNILSYLTFYAFKDDDFSQPVNNRAYSANDVNRVISLLEEESKTPHPDFDLQAAQTAGRQISNWLDKSRILPRRGQNVYFLPIPVALVAVIP